MKDLTVETFFVAPLAIPLSFDLSAAVIRPCALVVASEYVVLVSCWSNVVFVPSSAVAVNVVPLLVMLLIALDWSMFATLPRPTRDFVTSSKKASCFQAVHVPAFCALTAIFAPFSPLANANWESQPPVLSHDM